MKKKSTARQNKKLLIKLAMLDSLRGQDMCACVPLTHGRCDGVCRKNHLDQSNHVQCYEAYKVIDTDEYKDLRRQVGRHAEKQDVEVSDKDKRRHRIRNKQRESGSE